MRATRVEDPGAGSFPQTSSEMFFWLKAAYFLPPGTNLHGAELPSPSVPPPKLPAADFHLEVTNANIDVLTHADTRVHNACLPAQHGTAMLHFGARSRLA